MTALDSDATGSLLVRLARADERDAVMLGAGGRMPVSFCASVGELTARLRSDRIAGIVVDAVGSSGSELTAIAEVLEGQPAPVVLRLALAGIAIREALRHHDRLETVIVSVRGFNALDRDVATLLSPMLPGRSRIAILSRVAPLVSGPALRIITAAAAAGERAITVGEFADLCQLPVRTLEARLAGARVLPPKPLLQWMLAMHATWRITQEGWRPQQAAAAAGLRSADALSDRVERATGRRLAVVCDTLDFAGLLEVFAAVLVGREQAW